MVKTQGKQATFVSTLRQEKANIKPLDRKVSSSKEKMPLTRRKEKKKINLASRRKWPGLIEVGGWDKANPCRNGSGRRGGGLGICSLSLSLSPCVTVV